jgi:hypothetical protein
MYLLPVEDEEREKKKVFSRVTLGLTAHPFNSEKISI